MGKLLFPVPLFYRNNLAVQASKPANLLEEIICTAMAALHIKYPYCHLLQILAILHHGLKSIHLLLSI